MCMLKGLVLFSKTYVQIEYNYHADRMPIEHWYKLWGFVTFGP